METDPLDHWARFEMTFLKKDHESFFQYSRNDAQTIIDIAF
jgi:hypothetical protein